MKKLLPLLPALVIILTGCATKELLTYNLSSNTFTLNGKEMTSEDAVSYLSKDENSGKTIVVREEKSEGIEMSVSNFNAEAEKLVEAINDYYFPEGKEDSIFELPPDPANPFNVHKPEPVGSGQPM